LSQWNCPVAGVPLAPASAAASSVSQTMLLPSVIVRELGLVDQQNGVSWLFPF